MPITLPDDAQNQAIASIRRYVAEELDQDIGDLKARMLLEYFLKEIAPTVYNGRLRCVWRPCSLPSTPGVSAA